MNEDFSNLKENAEQDYITTPISVLRYIGEMEKLRSVLTMIIAVILLLQILFFIGGIYVGKLSIEDRAKELEKECYTNQDIEYIVFGEIQE